MGRVYSGEKLNCVSIHSTTCARDKAYIAPVVVHRRPYIPAIKTMDTITISLVEQWVYLMNTLVIQLYIDSNLKGIGFSLVDKYRFNYIVVSLN